MQYEAEEVYNQNINTDFADKMISFKGILKILAYFTIQASILMFQFKNDLQTAYVTNNNFWFYNNKIILSYLLNYAFFFGILLLFFAFNLGKELKTRKKEKFILFSFKFFIIGIIFLLTNGIFLFVSISYYLQAKMNNPFGFYALDMYINATIFLLFYLWFFIIVGFLLFKVFSFFIHLFSKKPKTKQKIVHLSKSNPFPNQQDASQPSSTFPTQTIHSSTAQSLSPNEEQALQKKEILKSQMKGDKEKNSIHVENKNDNQTISTTQTEKPHRKRLPRSFINFLDTYVFKLPLIEQIILFFTFTELIFLSLLSINLYSISLSNNLKYYYLPGINRQYVLMELLFYMVVSVLYYDILKNYFATPKDQSRNYALGLLGIGFILTLFSFGLVNNLTDANAVISYIILKYFVLLFIPIFYFGYKNQNQDKSEVNTLNKLNPVYSFFYKKSLNDLRMNEKSYTITKKFLQLHKDDFKKSLLNATPTNFRDNIKSVILADYERLETLLTFNGVRSKSKVAVMDFTMEVFSTFLVNIEVNLQDIYTEHLLKSSPENFQKPIGNEFIESKFSKLFSQWESLEITT